MPRWLHACWEWSGRASVKLHNAVSDHAAGRLLINGLGHVMATVWAVLDGTMGLVRGKPAIPATLPTEPLAPPLARFPGPLTRLATRGNQIVDEAGKPVRLRGVNLSGFEWSAEGGTANAAGVARVAAMGGNVLRLPINQGRALTDPAYMLKVDATIAEAAKRGVYVVVDMHWISGNQTATPDAETARMWRQLAQRWANQPAVVYDLHNEPGMVGWETNAAWAEHLIKAIRSVNPQSLVMVEGTNKAQRVAGALRRPINAPNVVYEVHAYGPRQHGPGVGPAQWDRLFGQVAEKYPVWVGEWGGEPDELPALQGLLRYLDGKGIGWAVWHSHAGEVFNENGTLAELGAVAAEAMRR